MSAGRAMSRPVGGPMQPGEVLGELGRAAAASPGASRRRRRRAGTRDRTPTGGAPSAGRSSPSTQTCAAVAAVAHATSSPPIAPSGPRALATVSSHSAAGSLPQVMPPPTCRVSRRPSATNVRMRMLVCIAPSGPIQPSAPVYGPRRTGSRPSRISIARIFGAPVIEPPGKRRGQQVERVAARRQPPGDGRDEVLDGGGPLEAAQARDADRARLADPAEVVAQDVDDHHVLGAVLGAGQQLAGERAVLGPVAAARPRALDRVAGDDAVRVDRQERLGRGATGAPAAGRSPGDGPEVEVGREQRRVAGPQAAVARPTGRRRTASRAGGSGSPGRCRRGRCGRGRARRRPRTRRATATSGSAGRRPRRRGGAVGGAVAAAPRARRGRRRQPRVDVVEPPGEPAAVAVERPAAEPGVAGPPVPGDDPVVEGEPQRRQALVVRARSTAAARGRARGRSRGTRRARRGTAAHRPGRRASGRAGRGAGGRRRTGPGRRPAPRARRRGRPSGTSSGRCGRAGRSRAGPDRAGRGRPRRRRWLARRRSGRAGVAGGAWPSANRGRSGRRGSRRR